MKAISLEHFPYFNDDRPLQQLNRLVEIKADLMPHQVAVATGCSLDEAMGILLLLFNSSLVEALLLVYHNDHLDAPPILARNILDGPPLLPFTCDICQNEIKHRDELSYDFLFKKASNIQFIA